MSSTIAICCMICLIAFAVSHIIFTIIALSKMTNIEENLQKTAILLTVIANKQGATNEDIANACSSEETAVQPAENTAKGKKKK